MAATTCVRAPDTLMSSRTCQDEELTLRLSLERKVFTHSIDIEAAWKYKDHRPPIPSTAGHQPGEHVWDSAQVAHIEDEAIADVAAFEAFESGLDRCRGHHLDVGSDVVLTAEVQHVLGISVSPAACRTQRLTA